MTIEFYDVLLVLRTFAEKELLHKQGNSFAYFQCSLVEVRT